MTRVFITGATGYIGGDVLSQLVLKYPQFVYRVLVRSAEKGSTIKSQYPSVQIVYGDLSSTEVLETESADANIIIHTADASDNLPAAKAIYAGILKGHTAENPAYWIHTSGAGIFSHVDEDEKTYGIVREKIYDDWDGIQEITSLPDHAFHRDVDKLVLGAGHQHPEVVKSAIISPVTVYGPGRGPVSKRSRQLYILSSWILERRKVPIIGEGQSLGTNVHITDVTDLFIKLFDAALDGRNHLWGPEAYYIAAADEHRWSDVARRIAQLAVEKGWIPTVETEALDHETAVKVAGYEAASWGLNSRGRARRARKLLGWKPAGPSVEEELPNILQGERERLQSQ